MFKKKANKVKNTTENIFYTCSKKIKLEIKRNFF